jgi:5'-nucleotidase
MAILVTNDDGILAEGLWALVKELRNIAPVVVVAPDREQSGIGTALTVHQPLRVNRVRQVIPGVDTFTVAGTPSDCVVVAPSLLAGEKIDMVVSGINQGQNLGHEDVLVSGTVSAALQGYLHGLHAVAVSVEKADNYFLDTAARLAALLSRWIGANSLPGNVFLNVNVPNLPLAEIKGVELTRLASGTHTHAAEKKNYGTKKFYWLVRRKTDKAAGGQTDVWALEQGNISITPLHSDFLNRSAPVIPNNLCQDLLRGLLDGRSLDGG